MPEPARANTVHEIMVLLRAGDQAVSRNRNFDLFEDPTARLALRKHKHLLGLERDLRRHLQRPGSEARIQLLPCADSSEDDPRVVLLLEIPAIRLKRRVYLSAGELELLRQAPGMERILPEGEQAREDTSCEQRG